MTEEMRKPAAHQAGNGNDVARIDVRYAHGEDRVNGGRAGQRNDSKSDLKRTMSAPDPYANASRS